MLPCAPFSELPANTSTMTRLLKVLQQPGRKNIYIFYSSLNYVRLPPFSTPKQILKRKIKTILTLKRNKKLLSQSTVLVYFVVCPCITASAMKIRFWQPVREAAKKSVFFRGNKQSDNFLCVLDIRYWSLHQLRTLSFTYITRTKCPQYESN